VNAETTAAPQQRRPGRPPCCPLEVLAKVVMLRRQGLSLTAISASLNQEDVPTPGGAQLWTKNRVDDLLHTRHAREYIAVMLDDTSPEHNPESCPWEADRGVESSDP
jgi:hypothetical protein